MPGGAGAARSHYHRVVAGYYMINVHTKREDDTLNGRLQTHILGSVVQKDLTMEYTIRNDVNPHMYYTSIEDYDTSQLTTRRFV